MIRVSHLFESHLAVSSLDRAVAFYRDVVGLSLAAVFDDRRVAFFWVGGAGQSMLGVWERGYSPQRMSLHIAFSVSLEGCVANGFRSSDTLAVNVKGTASTVQGTTFRTRNHHPVCPPLSSVCPQLSEPGRTHG